MKRNRTIRFWLATFFVVIASLAALGAPQFINYQGVLEQGGNPVPDGTYTVVFRIWNDEEYGDSIWGETHTVTTHGNNGKFNVKLGSIGGLPPEIFEDTDRWVGIEVYPDGEMVPRAQLGSVPFALLAQTVPDSTIDSMKIAWKSIKNENIKDKAIDSMKIADKSIRKENIKDEAIDSMKIAAKSIRKENIKDEAVDSMKIAAKSIRKENIKDEAIDSMKIAAKSIRKENIKDSAIDSTKIAEASVKGFNIKSKAIGKEHLADSVVHWTREGDVLFTSENLGIARAEASLNGDNRMTHVNLGVSSTTGSALNTSYSTVSGGNTNQALGEGATVSGGVYNQGTASYSTVGGGNGNVASGINSTIGGGGGNTAGPDQGTTVAGGVSNMATLMGATIGGGSDNSATAAHATVAGGMSNNTSGMYSAIGGGHKHKVEADYGTIPGGYSNSVFGEYSLAAGTGSKAYHEGSVVIAAHVWDGGMTAKDSVWTGGNCQMVLRADSLFYLTDKGEKAPANPGATPGNWFLYTSTGAYLSRGGTWQSSSSRDLKENFRDIDGEYILDRLKELKITQWNYKVDNDQVTHIGPVSQDFYAAFGLGTDDGTLSSIDPSGVALAAIKELIDQSEKRKARIDELEAELEEMKALIHELMSERR